MSDFFFKQETAYDVRISDWSSGVCSSDLLLDGALKGLLDHSQQEYIVSIHLVKLLSAVKTAITASPDAPWVPTVLAADRTSVVSGTRVSVRAGLGGRRYCKKQKTHNTSEYYRKTSSD